MKKLLLLLLLLLGVVGGIIFDHPKPPASPKANPEEEAIAPAPKLKPRLVSATSHPFDEKLKVALESLPTLSQLRALSAEEAHETPALIEKAGDILAEVATEVHDHPDWAPEASEFYQTCSLREDLPSSVRALCFSDYRDLTQKDLEVPASIRQLADQLKNTE